MASGDWSWIDTMVTGVAGIIGTAVAGARGRAHTEKLAWDQRHQDRIADAYVAVLEVAQRSNQ